MALQRAGAFFGAVNWRNAVPQDDDEDVPYLDEDLETVSAPALDPRAAAGAFLTGVNWRNRRPEPKRARKAIGTEHSVASVLDSFNW